VWNLDTYTLFLSGQNFDTWFPEIGLLCISKEKMRDTLYFEIKKLYIDPPLQRFYEG